MLICLDCQTPYPTGVPACPKCGAPSNRTTWAAEPEGPAPAPEPELILEWWFKPGMYVAGMAWLHVGWRVYRRAAPEAAEVVLPWLFMAGWIGMVMLGVAGLVWLSRR